MARGLMSYKLGTSKFHKSKSRNGFRNSSKLNLITRSLNFFPNSEVTEGLLNAAMEILESRSIDYLDANSSQIFSIQINFEY